MEDTYLPAFRAAVVEGHAGSVMCSYNSVNGEPVCANTFLPQNQLRGAWKFDGCPSIAAPGLRLRNFGVDANPMGPHGCAHLVPRCFHDDGIGWLPGHVAVNAVVCNLRAYGLRHLTTLDTMAAQAPVRICGRGAFGCVNVVTG